MCLSIILRWIINAVVIILITYIVPGFLVETFYTALIVSMVLALVNAFIKPIVMFLTLPINLLTLGLFTFVTNGLMFWIVSSIVKGFTITNFWSAILAAVVYSLISMIISYFDSSSKNEVKIVK